MNSNAQSMPQSPKRLRIALVWFLGASFVGFLDSAYLTVTHFIGEPVACGFFTGCELVTSSSYSAIAGVPIALFGALYYLFWVLLGVWYLDSRNPVFFTLLPLTSAGFVASLILIGIQVFIINAICIYCLLSAASSTALFILSFIIRKASRGETLATIHPPQF